MDTNYNALTPAHFYRSESQTLNNLHVVVPPPPQYRPSVDRLTQYCRWFSSAEYVFLGYV